MGRFSKMHGLGNDFVVIDARTGPVAMTEARVRAIADRHAGIGCDQLIVIGDAPDADVSMQIFNADGSEVEACGNATRCVPLFVGRDKSVAALERAMEQDKEIFLVAQLDPARDDPDRDDLYDIGVVATVVPPSTDRLFSTTAPSFPSSFPVSSISISVSVSVSVSPSPRARFPVPRPSSSSSSLSLPSSRARLPDVTVRSPSLPLTSRETSSQCVVTNVATNSRPSATHRSRNASTSSPTDPTRKKHPELRTTFTTRASTSASTALCARFGVTTCEMP